MMATTFGMALGGWLTGEIFDWTGSYQVSPVEWDQLEHPEHDPDRSALDSADAAEITGGIFDRLIVFIRKNELPDSFQKTRACF